MAGGGEAAAGGNSNENGSLASPDVRSSLNQMTQLGNMEYLHANFK